MNYFLLFFKESDVCKMLQSQGLRKTLVLMLLVLGIASVCSHSSLQAQTTYYYISPGSPHLVGSWNTRSEGGGASPASFNGVGDTYIIITGTTANLAANWTFGTGATVGSLLVQSGAILNINNGLTMFNNGTTTIQGGGSLNLSGTGTVNGVNSVVYASTLATVRFVGTPGKTIQPQEVPASMPGSVFFNPPIAVSYTLGSSTTVAGYVTNGTQSLLNTGPFTLQIGSRGLNQAGAGNLVVNSGGVLALSDGAVWWNDRGLFVQAGGTLRLEGTGQVLGATAVTYTNPCELLYTGGSNRVVTPIEMQTFSPLNANLGINKTPGTGVELWGARTLGLGSILSLTSGTIRTSTSGGLSPLILQNNSPLAVTGGNVNSYVDGPLRRSMSTTTWNYNFPVGEGGAYRPLNLGNPNTNSIMEAQAMTSATTPTVAAPITSVLNNQAWRVWAVTAPPTTTLFATADVPGAVNGTTQWTTSATLGGSYYVRYTTASVSGITVHGNIGPMTGLAANQTYLGGGTFVTPTTYYFFPNAPNDVGNTLCWWSNPGGPAAGGINPTNFTTNGQNFIVETGYSATLVSTPWIFGTGANVPTLTVQNGAILRLNTGVTMFNNGTTTVQNGGSLNIAGNGAVNGENSVFYQSTLATLRYLSGATKSPLPQELPLPMPGSVLFTPAIPTTYNLAQGAIVNGHVTVGTMTTLNTQGNTLQLNLRGTIEPGGNMNINSNGVLMVSDGVVLWNSGGLANQATGTLRLEGTGQVLGTSVVNHLPTSNLLYTGGSNRVVTPIEMQTFSPLNANLGINKTPGTGVELWGARTLGLGSILSLTSGTIRTSTSGGLSPLILQNNSPLAVTGGNVNSYVDGPLRRNMSATTWNYNFPVGTGGVYSPLNLGNTNTTPTIEVEAVSSNPTTATVLAPITSLLNNRGWRMQALAAPPVQMMVMGDVPGSVNGATLWVTAATISGEYKVAITSATVVGTTLLGDWTPMLPFPWTPINQTYIGGGSFTQPTTFYFYPLPTADAGLVQNWYSNPGGPTGGGLRPQNFITTGNQFIVQSGYRATLISPSWLLGTGANVPLLNVQNGAILEIASPNTMFNNGTTTIEGGGSLSIAGNGTVNGMNAIIYQNTTATLRYIGSATKVIQPQELPALMQGSVFFNPGFSTYNFALSSVVMGYVTNANNSTLNIQSGATLEIGSRAENTAPTGNITVQANGVLALSNGALLQNNKPLNVAANGTVRLDGTGQVLGGTVVSYVAGSNLLYTGGSNRVATPLEIPAFSMNGNLRINKVAGTGIELWAPRTLSPTSILSLTSGTIRTSTMGGLSPLILQNTMPLAVTGGNVNSYVDGPLQRTLANNNYIFPVGSGGQYMPVLMPNVSAGGGQIGVQAYNTATTGTAGAGVQNISATEYWRLYRTGSFTSGGVAFHRPNIQADDILITTTSTIPTAPLVAVNSEFDPDTYADVTGFAKSSSVIPFSSLFTLSNTAFFALGVGSGQSAFAGFGTALNLNGATQYGSVPTGYTLSGGFTVEALVNPRSAGSQRTILSKYDCTNGGYDLSLDASGRAVFTVFTDCSAGGSDAIQSTNLLPINRWTHIAVSRNAFTNRYELYLNGILESAQSIARAPGISSSPLLVGARTGSMQLFNGLIDEVRIWNTNLSTIDAPTVGAIPSYRGVEVSASHPNSISLAGYWKFNGTLGATAPNSASGAAMSLIAMPTYSGSSTSCSIVANTATPLAIQLPGSKSNGTVTFATIDAMNGGATRGTVSLASSGLLIYTPNTPISTPDVFDSFSYRVSDGIGSTSNATVYVHFKPSAAPIATQVVEAGVPTNLPQAALSIAGGIAPFTITHLPRNFIQPTAGTLTTDFRYSTNAALTLTRTVSERYGFATTQPITITPVFTPTTLAFSAVSSTGTQGLPLSRIFDSGTAQSISVGVFNPGGLRANITSGTVQVQFLPQPGGTAQFLMENNQAVFSLQSAQTLDSLRVLWLNPPLEGGFTQATIRAVSLGNPSVQSTSLTVTVRGAPIPPTITSFSPIGGNVGRTVIVNGINFGGLTAARIGAVNLSMPTVLSSTQISVIIPVGAVTAPITLEFSNGNTTSVNPFLVMGTPIVDLFDPQIGARGREVTINGINFFEPLQVFFGDSLASSVIIDSPMQIRARVGNGMTGRIRVETLGGIGRSDSTFVYVPVPRITSFAPLDAPRGGIVTVTGADFTVIDSLLVGSVRMSSINLLNSNTLQFRLDSAVSGAVQIFSPAGSTSASVGLRLLNPPVISAFSPSIGAAGTVITVSGQNFINVTSLTIGSITISTLIVDSPSQIRIVLSSAMPQSARIFLTTPAGTAQSDSAFRYVGSPTISSLQPEVAGAGQFITITGANLSVGAVPRILFGAVPSDSVQILSPTAIRVRIPANAQSGFITLTTPGGMISTTQAFVVALPPDITEFTPERGGSGTVVTIRGTNFYNVSEVRFGNVTAASYINTTPQTILAQVGAGESGRITVITPLGSTTGSRQFEYLPNVITPIITSFSPESGIRGDVVEIIGRNFTNATRVSFGGIGASQFRVLSDTRISASVAGGATGIVQVSSPSGIGFSVRQFRFVGDTTEVANQTPLQQDSTILARFHGMTAGRTWFEQTNWLTDLPVSLWAGVRVARGRIVGIQLSNNGLRGTLPAFLGQLSDLEELDLSFNELEGEIPRAIATLPALRVLKLNNNRLTGFVPESFGTRATLQILHLQNNTLTGNVTSAICSQVMLRELNIAENTIEGSIPACIGSLRELRVLNLSANRFADTIPASLGNLTNLRELVLAGNRLRGAIPQALITNQIALAAGKHSSNDDSHGASLQASPELRLLDVSNNELSDLPHNIGLLRELEVLRLGRNQFSGELPNLATLTKLRTLELNDNRLVGAFPEAIGQMRGLQTLSLANNQFRGAISSLIGRLDSLRILNLSGNIFEDSVPQALQSLRILEHLNLANNRLRFLPNLSGLRRLLSLSLEGNRFTFEHIEPYTFLTDFTFAPQDSVGERSEQTFATGNSVAISLRIGGKTNLFQWLKNNVPISGQRDSVLRFATFSRRDTGDYVCRVVSSEARLNELILYSRPFVIRALPPVAPQGRIVLISPVPNAQAVPARNVIFSWRAIDDASSYEIEVATNPAFSGSEVFRQFLGARPIAVIGNLAFLTRYFWRVRGLNDGLPGAWSEVRSFITLEESEPMTVEQLDFGNVPLGNSSAAQTLLLRNTTTTPLVVVSVQMNNEDGGVMQSASQQHFRFSQIPQTESGGVLRLDSTLGYGVVFEPKSPGFKSAKITIQYRLSNGVIEQTRTYTTAVQGFGSILSAEPLNFDTVVVGRGTGRVQALQVTNRADGRAQVIRMEMTPRSLALGFSLEDLRNEHTFRQRGETAQFLVRCNPKITGVLRGELMMLSNLTGDTVFVPLLGFGRGISQNDVLLSTKFVANRDSVPPGSTTEIQFQIASIRALRNGSLAEAGIPDLQRVSQPRVGIRVRMSPQVLIPAPSETKLQFVRFERDGSAIYDIPLQLWLGQSRTLLSFKCLVLAGSAETTQIECLDLTWDRTNALPGSAVVPDTLSVGRFTAAVSRAGGTRLVIRRDSTITNLVLKPNPANDVLDVSFSLDNDIISSEAPIVEVLSLSGATLKTDISLTKKGNDFSAQINARNLPSGSYLVRLRAGLHEVSRPIVIIH